MSTKHPQIGHRKININGSYPYEKMFDLTCNKKNASQSCTRISFFTYQVGKDPIQKFYNMFCNK